MKISMIPRRRNMYIENKNEGKLVDFLMNAIFHKNKQILFRHLQSKTSNFRFWLYYRFGVRSTNNWPATLS